MNRNPSSSKASRFAADSIPASATTTMSCAWWRSRNRDQRLGLGLVALEQVHFQREPGGGGEQPDGDLRIDAVFLAHPDLAQLVLTLDLEVQGRDVVEHHRQSPGPGGVRV
ncbi:MAG TPA: hypothetical protein VJ418_26225, partial [Streptosporangiaceae bacterium]|nr:hypothetical protein [Streptosporangiaceae bacterium]